MKLTLRLIFLFMVGMVVSSCAPQDESGFYLKKELQDSQFADHKSDGPQPLGEENQNDGTIAPVDNQKKEDHSVINPTQSQDDNNIIDGAQNIPSVNPNNDDSPVSDSSDSGNNEGQDQGEDQGINQDIPYNQDEESKDGKDVDNKKNDEGVQEGSEGENDDKSNGDQKDATGPIDPQDQLPPQNDNTPVVDNMDNLDKEGDENKLDENTQNNPSEELGNNDDMSIPEDEKEIFNGDKNIEVIREVSPQCVMGKRLGIWLDMNNDGNVSENDLFLGDVVTYAGPLTSVKNYNYFSASAHPIYGPKPMGYSSNFFFYQGEDGLTFNFFFNIDGSGSKDNSVKFEIFTSGNAGKDSVLFMDDPNHKADIITRTLLKSSEDSDVASSRVHYAGQMRYFSNTDGAVIGPFEGEEFKIRFVPINLGDSTQEASFYSANGASHSLKAKEGKMVYSYVIAYKNYEYCVGEEAVIQNGDQKLVDTGLLKEDELLVTDEIPFESEDKISCSPLSEVSQDQNQGSELLKGLVGNVRILKTSHAKSEKKNDLLSYLSPEFSELLPHVIYMDQVDVAPRHFEMGFSTKNGDYIRNAKNEKIVEWFNVNLETVLKIQLPQEEGFYEFVALSDDGIILNIEDLNEGVIYKNFLYAPNTQAPKVICYNGPEKEKRSLIYLKNGQDYKLGINYFQGPRTEIALMLFWKKIENPLKYKRSKYCMSTQRDYNVLIKDGFVIVPQKFFHLPAGKVNHCKVDDQLVKTLPLSKVPSDLKGVRIYFDDTPYDGEVFFYDKDDKELGVRANSIYFNSAIPSSVKKVKIVYKTKK